MNKIIIMLVLFLSSTSVFAAERWIAKCTDGKNIHYVQKYKGFGHLFMDVTLPSGKGGLFPIATLRQSKSTAVSICGVVLGNGDPEGQPISQICMNRDRQIIYAKFNHPKQNNPNIIEEGEFCKADVKVLSDY